jgi:hypothetical protein
LYINPYEKTFQGDGQWLKASFHIHAGTGKGTCGAYDIDDVIALYREAEYNVLTISNHDIFTDVSAYEAKHDIVLLNGFEYSQHPHMLCLHNKALITVPHQEAVLECVRQGGFVVLCHPNWQQKEYWAWKDIDALTGYSGIEIFNGCIFDLSGTGLATDTWDHVLSQGKLVWAFGSDDFHRWYDLSRSWNVIHSVTKEHDDIQSSILNGSSYVSTGLILRNIQLEDGTIRVTSSAKNSYVKNYRYVFIGRNGVVLEEQVGEHGNYHLAGDELYVRVQVISEHGAMLWTQPIYHDGSFQRP